MNSPNIILLITLFVTQLSFGQKPVIGVKAGLAFSNATIKLANPDIYNSEIKTSTRTGALGGVYLDVPSGKKFLLRPGIEVVSKGTRDGNDLDY